MSKQQTYQVIGTTLHNSWNQAIASIKPCRAAGSTVALDASAVVRALRRKVLENASARVSDLVMLCLAWECMVFKSLLQPRGGPRGTHVPAEPVKGCQRGSYTRHSNAFACLCTWPVLNLEQMTRQPNPVHICSPLPQPRWVAACEVHAPMLQYSQHRRAQHNRT